MLLFSEEDEENDKDMPYMIQRAANYQLFNLFFSGTRRNWQKVDQFSTHTECKTKYEKGSRFEGKKTFETIS